MKYKMTFVLMIIIFITGLFILVSYIKEPKINYGVVFNSRTKTYEQNK
jgi:hypothetical protein